jgi:hypothetical protein
MMVEKFPSDPKGVRSKNKGENISIGQLTYAVKREERSMKKLNRVFLVLSLIALMAGPALAGLAVDFTGVTTELPDINGSSISFSLGWQFTTNGPVTVAALGFYDGSKNGLTQNHDVGIYDAGGNLLVSTTVLTTDPLVSFFRTHNIAPIVLQGSHTYYIMAVTGTEKYTFNTIGFTVDPSINFIQDEFYPFNTGVLVFPTNTNGITAAAGGGFFGPDFSNTAVPVPPSLLLLGSGLLGLVGWRRFRKD